MIYEQQSFKKKSSNCFIKEAQVCIMTYVSNCNEFTNLSDKIEMMNILFIEGTI